MPVAAKAGQRLDEVLIQNTEQWGKKHWRTIEQSYRRAPYFRDYAGFLEETYGSSWETLNALNRHMLEFYLDALGISTRISYSSELEVQGEATERLINLIRAVDGTHYYSGAFALDAYLDAGMLEDAGVELQLQEWTAPQYPQLYGTFIPDLSIVDLLMICGPDSLNVIMDKRNDTA